MSSSDSDWSSEFEEELDEDSNQELELETGIIDPEDTYMDSMENMSSINESDMEETTLDMEIPVEETSRFQKEIWQLRLLPYNEELKRDADSYFSHIKTGLAHSVLYRDARPGFIYWVCELDRFMQLYSRRFTKTDHINIVQLLASALTIDKLDFRVVKVVSSVLSTLLSRKNLLSRQDVQFYWKPLFDLYVEISYRNLEEDGVFLLPENLKKTLGGVILEMNNYFSESATQEILDEVRPMICPWDDSMNKALSIMCLFLPTTLKPEEHKKFGANLWFDELWHWFACNECNSTVDEKILSIFARLAKDCPGYIDWSDKFELIFSKLIRAFKLEVGTDRVTLSSGSRIFGSVSFMIAYTLGGPNDGVQPYLDQLFLTLESYFYPSNIGAYTTNLLTFCLKLVTNVAYRVSRERYHPERHMNKVPDSIRLTDAQIDKLTKSILPCLKYAAFSKTQKQELVPSIMRILSFLSPGLLIPTVLDMVYPSLETVTEPHRLFQSLHILSCICVSLVRDNPAASNGERLPIEFTEETFDHTRSYKRHALNILVNILPGIDVNDIGKSTLTFQIIGILLLLIPVADCSEAPLVRDDLTEEEKELCSATAVFDTFVEQLVNKIFSMIEMLGNSSQLPHHGGRHNLTKLKAKSMEEVVIEKGVLTVFKALIRNCNSAIYERLTDEFFSFLKGNMYESKPAMDLLTRMTTSVVAIKPRYAFPIFFNFVSDKFFAHIAEHKEIFDDEEVDTTAIWCMTLSAEIIRGSPGDVLLENREKVDQLLSLFTRFKCKDATYLAAGFAQNVLSSLCSLYPRTKGAYETLDKPFDKYLPIRHWAHTINKKTWKIDWHIPSADEVAYATDITKKLVFDNLETLSNAEKMTDAEILRCLSIVRCCLEGCSNLCPYFDGEIIPIVPTSTPNIQFLTTVLPLSVKMITAPNGENFRHVVFHEIKKISDYMMTKRENDTKSMMELVGIMRILLHVKGICPSSYQMQHTTFQMTKKVLSDPLKGSKAIIESVMEGDLAFIHAKRQLTKPLIALTTTHIEAFKLLIRFGTSSYSGVRIESQKILDSSFSSWTYSYKTVLDEILKIICCPSEYAHKQFKGALYMLLNGKELSICVRQDWETLNNVWPCMVKAQHSEKPSIIALFDTAHDIIVNNFSSFQISFKFSESIMPIAKKVIEKYNGCVHDPVWPDLTEKQLKEAQATETERNEKNIKLYYQLCDELLKLSVDSKLHWRHVDMAQSFLSLMLRKDMEFPADAVQLYFKLLVSDTIKTRKMAIAFLSSWLKINKPKSVKRAHPIENTGHNNGPNAKWPIKYGFRKDNALLLYDQAKQPKTASEWNSTRFFFKIHYGFYTWPKEFKSYAPATEQVEINRNEFTALEKSIVSMFDDEAIAEKLINFLSLEEKKGQDEFNAITYSLFYRLFRNYNDQLFPSISKQLDKLLKDKREGAQRLASEIVAGLINGSKLWTFEKLEKIWAWLRPRLSSAWEETISNESERNWGTCLATICGTCEPRMIGWLLDLLFALVRKPTENTFHMTTRLYLLHCALNQFEWRIPSLWYQLFCHCSQLVGHTYQNMRFRVGSCLASSAFSELPGIYVDPELQSSLNLVTEKQIIGIMDSQLKATGLWKMVFREDDGDANTSDQKTATTSVPIGVVLSEADLKRGRLIMITMVNTIYSLASVSLAPLNNATTLRLIPLLAHFSNETNEEELKSSCQTQLIRSMAPADLSDENILVLLDVCEQTVARCSWWKTKMLLLRFLQVHILSNIFIMRKCKQRVQDLVLSLMSDPRLDVRISAAQTLSGFIHCGYFSADTNLIERVVNMASSKQSEEQHSGVLALSAIIQAFPYSVPSFLPSLLMALCKHAHDREPNYGVVKKALSEFKRTHQDSWHEHKQEFTEEQLCALTDLLVSPNYYV
ncbi:proteasome-substrate-size regulator, mid region domain-containing protein [Ditylenchus destructor]|uniref:Proteasome-substrate-size regulator, mid region domain-containing protein n=1 Tax=Ditylenchus destructor TaxID=166010 RepID=A0AAD4RAF3_9BILA|nr:proteasome-substrate-size regulator, mid region domain-containing protein [Ditylenchus destructor]